MIPPTKPNKIPPKDNLINITSTYPADIEFPSTISNKTRKTTIAVPSLSKLSPSIIVASLLEAPSSFSKATTATGSVAEIMDPYSKLAFQVKLSLY